MDDEKGLARPKGWLDEVACSYIKADVYNPRRNAGNRVTIGPADASLSIPNGRAAVDNAETKVDNDAPSRVAAWSDSP